MNGVLVDCGVYDCSEKWCYNSRLQGPTQLTPYGFFPNDPEADPDVACERFVEDNVGDGEIDSDTSTEVDSDTSTDDDSGAIEEDGSDASVEEDGDTDVDEEGDVFVGEDSDVVEEDTENTDSSSSDSTTVEQEGDVDDTTTDSSTGSSDTGVVTAGGGTSSSSDPSESDASSPASTLEPAKSEGSSSGSCFPADANVILENGERKTMSMLQIGDSIQVSKDKYSKVLMFTHRLSHGVYLSIELRTRSGKRIRLSTGHYLHIDGNLVTAGTAKTGQLVLNERGEWEEIVGITQARTKGLYNPQTLHGDIVVDGIVASTYTQAVDVSVAHTLLSPLRLMYTRFGLSTKAF